MHALHCFNLKNRNKMSFSRRVPVQCRSSIGAPSRSCSLSSRPGPSRARPPRTTRGRRNRIPTAKFLGHEWPCRKLPHLGSPSLKDREVSDSKNQSFYTDEASLEIVDPTYCAKDYAMVYHATMLEARSILLQLLVFLWIIYKFSFASSSRGLLFHPTNMQRFT